MAVQIPPWLNIDPLAPARIRLQANAQRNAADASIRAAQAHAQELQFQRESADAHERAALRRDEVLKQTHDQELAQAAQQMQLHRESQAQRANQFQQTLRMKQQAAEVEAKNAAQQMQGMKALQEGLKQGRPMQELLAENAPMIFAGRADRAVGALQRGSRIATVPDYVAHELKTEQGQGTGVMVRAGAGGTVVPLPRTRMSPEGMLRADQLRLGIINRQLEDETDPAKAAALTQARDGIMSRLEQIASGRGAVASPAGVNAQIPAAASAPISDTVRVQSPSGKLGTIPRAQLDAAIKGGYKEIAPSPAEESNFTEESDTGTPQPEDNQE